METNKEFTKIFLFSAAEAANYTFGHLDFKNNPWSHVAQKRLYKRDIFNHSKEEQRSGHQSSEVLLF